MRRNASAGVQPACSGVTPSTGSPPAPPRHGTDRATVHDCGAAGARVAGPGDVHPNGAPSAGGLGTPARGHRDGDWSARDEAEGGGDALAVLCAAEINATHLRWCWRRRRLARAGGGGAGSSLGCRGNGRRRRAERRLDDLRNRRSRGLCFGRGDRRRGRDGERLTGRSRRGGFGRRCRAWGGRSRPEVGQVARDDPPGPQDERHGHDEADQPDAQGPAVLGAHENWPETSHGHPLRGGGHHRWATTIAHGPGQEGFRCDPPRQPSCRRCLPVTFPVRPCWAGGRRGGARASGWPAQQQHAEGHQPDAPQDIPDEVGQVDDRQVQRRQDPGEDEHRRHRPEDREPAPGEQATERGQHELLSDADRLDRHRAEAAKRWLKRRRTRTAQGGSCATNRQLYPPPCGGDPPPRPGSAAE